MGQIVMRIYWGSTVRQQSTEHEGSILFVLPQSM